MASSAGPRITGRKDQPGVLHVNTQKAPVQKAVNARLKVIVRRLAPGLTEAEFSKVLGDEWKVGGGKVDWFLYKAGKDSKDASKQSRPSRAYLHLLSETDLLPLSEAVRSRSFEDAQNTYTSSSLVGPPVVEFAPYGRVPGGRKRADVRQGTIDQDPVFMDFLESLINPVNTKEETEDSAAEKGVKVTTTPLVQFLKDKKAKKAKDSDAAKAAKKQDAKSLGKGKDGKDSKVDKFDKTIKDKRAVAEKATPAVVNVVKREAGKAQVSQPGQPTSAPSEPSKTGRPATRERGSVAAAARILQRDLGLAAGAAHRKAKADAAKAGPATASSPATIAKPGRAGRGQAPFGTNTPPDTPSAPAGMVLLKKPATTSESTPNTTPQQPQSNGFTRSSTPSSAAGIPSNPPDANPPVSAQAAPTRPKLANATPSSTTATRAFVKHANPSQGVTEGLLKTAMSNFGAVKFVEIDRKKGFAYVDFAEPEGLRGAMAGSPVKVGEGNVVVLERKDRGAGGAGNAPVVANAAGAPGMAGGRGGYNAGFGRRGGARGGVRGGRGGSAAGGGVNNATSAPIGQTAK